MASAPRDEALRQLLERGKRQGHLTWADARAYLNEAGNQPDRLDKLLAALEENGIELLDEDGDEMDGK
jgi:RNA polymerase primary sigma factor